MKPKQYLYNEYKTDSTASSDGLVQNEREAIIDLLLLGIYQDNHLSLAEDQVFHTEVDAFQWESTTAIEIY